MKQRSLLLVDLLRKGYEIENLLKENNWNVINCCSAEFATKFINEKQIALGLVVVSEGINSQHILALKALFEQRFNILWQMIVSPKLERLQEIRDLIALYCFDYHTLPVNDSRLLLMLGHAYGMAMLYKQPHSNVLTQQQDPGITFIGESQEICLVKQQITKVADTDATVLIMGESGTGKELIAKSIHQNSSRAGSPIIALNCAAFPDNLIYSELFGYEKGAFTGALQRKIGRLEQADQGTLFLDEIGDLPMAQQVNFLRFLQEGTLDRIGGSETLQVDVRVVAATHVDLEKAIKLGAFREDLYYRLNVVTINVPPLRERPGDIELLAYFFLKKYADKYNPQICGFSKRALIAMRSHQWPGNIRELINRVRRATMLSEKRLLTEVDLALNTKSFSCTSLAEARDIAEKEIIQQSLLKCGHNISEAARYLKISRLTLYRLIEKHGIQDKKRNTTIDIQFAH